MRPVKLNQFPHARSLSFSEKFVAFHMDEFERFLAESDTEEEPEDRDDDVCVSFIRTLIKLTNS